MKHKTPGKFHNLFIFLSLVLSLSFSIVIAEWVLRYQRQSVEHKINSSEKMQAGMILYDAQLGWKLKPYWSGKHHHYDYDAVYNINREGFRGSSASPEVVDYAVIGDSFAFGLGVNDDKTFTARLNAMGTQNNTFRNYSVPGYSTDQQLLLLKKLNGKISKNILLVVYLGNDVFDNMCDYPLQASHGKPYFKLNNNVLTLKNTPVPLTAKSAAAGKDSITGIVLGGEIISDSFTDWLARLEISRRLGLFQKKTVLSVEVMRSRFFDAMKLFTALVYEIEEVTHINNGRLHVVLLPGRSYVEQPDSLSAQYQEYFRQDIKKSLQLSSINVMDLASHLRTLQQSGIHNLYYPNEGHLTPLGHRYVADYLTAKLNHKTLQ